MITHHNSTVTAGKAVVAETQLRRVFDLCVRKTHKNIQRLADEPKSAALAVDGDYFHFPEGFYDIGNWTSSFFTGMALLAWRETEDEFFLKQTLRLSSHYRAKVFDPKHVLETHHDLGFLYTLYSVALYQLTGNAEHREVGLRAAEVLAQRFHEKGDFIRAWGRMDTDEFDNMAIIDCLMNLPLLHWAAIESGNPKYREIAIRHADMALKVFVRPDGSVYHAYRFDLKTGKPLRGDTFGGWAVESHWARGAAWAMYGFALSYGYTQDQRYLDAAVRLGKKFVENLDEHAVPVWDFKLLPDMPPIRDASAASVAVCGFQELAKHGAADGEILHAKKRLLAGICNDAYLNFDLNVPGIQRNGMVGDGQGLGKNAYTSWGDYYLMEAVVAELFQSKKWW